MIGTITPLVQGAAGRSRWTSAIVLYGVGSLVASASLGAILGVLGKVLELPLHVSVIVLATLAIFLALRELGVLDFPAPRFSRQTRKQWFLVGGAERAAFLWGLDLGFGLSTTRVFSSFWLLPVGALLLADPLAGALVMGSYGLGRTLLVATGPLLPRGPETTAFLADLMRSERQWHRLHATAVGLSGVLLVLVL